MITESEVMEAAPVLHTAEVTKSGLKEPTSLTPAFRLSVPIIMNEGSLFIQEMEAFVTYNSWS